MADPSLSAELEALTRALDERLVQLDSRLASQQAVSRTIDERLTHLDSRLAAQQRPRLFQSSMPLLPHALLPLLPHALLPSSPGQWLLVHALLPMRACTHANHQISVQLPALATWIHLT